MLPIETWIDYFDTQEVGFAMQMHATDGDARPTSLAATEIRLAAECGDAAPGAAEDFSSAPNEGVAEVGPKCPPILSSLERRSRSTVAPVSDGGVDHEAVKLAGISDREQLQIQFTAIQAAQPRATPSDCPTSTHGGKRKIHAHQQMQCRLRLTTELLGRDVRMYLQMPANIPFYAPLGQVFAGKAAERLDYPPPLNCRRDMRPTQSNSGRLFRCAS